ncbi:endocuticle structural glycoprotein SgAbd-5-like [Galleria mellonella]|uniref:Endocuticle structural glycoprotein SgAbd-5-like n=1 Tax=Galleria mellonella TaxID=7137 RepID=A0A6J1WKH1_GALME|nr:endocuticle structural glycoprotein SgAbd-5-like [Galleria mellonella]
MNKLLLVLYFVLAVISVNSQLIGKFLAGAQNTATKLLKSDNNNDGSGNYYFNYEQSDGTKHEETGVLKDPGSLNPFVVAKGFYEWISPENRKYHVQYEADQNGYRPKVEEGPGATPIRVVATMMGG